MKEQRQLIGVAALAAVAVVGGAMLLSGLGVTQVPAGADLQAAMNAASTGDTLQLANATYVCNCVDSKGLTLLGPAKIVTPNADPAIIYPPATPPATLRNLEVTTTVGWPQVFSIVRYGDGGTAQDTFEEQPQGLTMDSVWVHGQTTQEVQRCVAANGRNFKFTNSRATDCHGRGYDSQAIAVWNGSGPFTITDSYLEGAGENVMFGGSPPSIPGLVHSDIEIRRNHFFKPPAWRGVWTVKNLFELKNARNVIIDGNVFENNWTDAQAGWAIQFTPRPSDSGTAAVVEDVTFTNNIIRNSDQGVNLLGADQSPAPTDVRLRRVRIANCVFEDIRGTLITNTNGTDQVTIEHVTAFHGGNVISSDYAPSTNFIYRDNITRHNLYGIFGSGHSIGNDSINYYFPGSTIMSNVIAKEVDSPSNAETLYPAGNYFPVSLDAVGFVDRASGNYRLATSSPYKGKGTGGTDPGADIDALLAAQGVGTPTPTPVPTPSPLPSPTPTPVVTVCKPNQRQSTGCKCLTQWIGNPKRCKP